MSPSRRSRARRPSSSPAAASGACRVCSSTSKACSTPSPATPAATRARRNTTSFRPERRGTPNRCASPTIRARITLGQILRVYFSVAHDPTETQPPGPRFRHAVPLGDLPAECGTGPPRQGLYRRDQPGPHLPRGARHQDRAGACVLPRRGLPSGLSDPAPRRALHRRKRPAEARRPQGDDARPLPRAAGAGVEGGAVGLRRRPGRRRNVEVHATGFVVGRASAADLVCGRRRRFVPQPPMQVAAFFGVQTSRPV